MSDSISSIASLGTVMQQQKTAQQVNMAVLNKAQDIQKQQGEAAVKLIQSATPASTSTNSIDVYA